MPNPIFEPTIASNFDNLAAQRAQWASFNRSIEGDNIARANAAEQNQNNWLARVAEIQNTAAQADMQRQLNQSNIERQLALDQRGSDRAEKLRQQELAAEHERTLAMTKGTEMKLDLQEKARQAEIENRGSGFAQQYAYNKRLADAADSQVEPLQAQNDAAEKRLGELQAMPKKTDEQLAEMAMLKSRTVDLKPKLTAALKAKNSAEASLARLEGTMAAHGYTADDEQGHIMHIDTGKKWNFRNAVKQAAAAVPPPPASAAAPVEPAQGFWSKLGTGIGNIARGIPSVLNPMQAGFDSTAEPPTVAPAPLTAPNAPVKIGRFIVSPAQ